MQQIANKLIQGLQEYTHAYNISQAIVGISGGVDSAVTATIAAKALGAQNVMGFLMPHAQFSSAENLQDARELTEILGIQTQEIDIDAFCAPFFNLAWTEKTMTKGNIMARVRMVILYSWANTHNALVLGTCNKTETLLGYETKFGDGACDICVLGNLWKKDVWALAEYFQLPQKFITKAPSAELFHAQTDEEEMGFSYEFADTILARLENKNDFDTSDILVQKLLQMVKKNQHKRQLSPTLKI